MLFKKKILHFLLIKKSNNLLIPHDRHHMYFIKSIIIKNPFTYIKEYKLNFKTYAKFSFPILLYSILNVIKEIHLLFFKIISINMPSTKILRNILRAPCNHKNSKEQYGRTTYKNLIICQFKPINALFIKYFTNFLLKRILPINLRWIEKTKKYENI